MWTMSLAKDGPFTLHLQLPIFLNQQGHFCTGLGDRGLEPARACEGCRHQTHCSSTWQVRSRHSWVDGIILSDLKHHISFKLIPVLSLLEKIMGYITNVGHGCGWALVWAWVANFKPPRNPHLWVRVCRQAQVLFFFGYQTIIFYCWGTFCSTQVTALQECSHGISVHKHPQNHSIVTYVFIFSISLCWLGISRIMSHVVVIVYYSWLHTREPLSRMWYVHNIDLHAWGKQLMFPLSLAWHSLLSSFLRWQVMGPAA